MNVKIFTGVLNFVLPARITRASKNIFTPNKTGRKENREDEKNPSNKDVLHRKAEKRKKRKKTF